MVETTVENDYRAYFNLEKNENGTKKEPRRKKNEDNKTFRLVQCF